MHLRPVTEQDLPAILELHRRSEAFDKIPTYFEMADLRSFIDGVQTNMATDTLLAQRGEEILGYVHTYHLPSEVRLERCYVFGQVDPDHRRQGIGTELMGWGVDRAESLLRSSGSSLPKFIRSDHFDFDEGRRGLFLAHGLSPVRFHDQMRQPLDDLPSMPPQPEGIRIIPWPVERNAEIRQVKNAAFADHWGSTPTSPELWDQMMSDETTRLDLSLVAVNESDDIVAYCTNDRYPSEDAVFGRKEAWIGNLGTLSDYRGRGIASSLIINSLRLFADHGLTHACIDVDSDSLTGARRLYESLGFKPVTRTITYERQIDETPIG